MTTCSLWQNYDSKLTIFSVQVFKCICQISLSLRKICEFVFVISWVTHCKHIFGYQSCTSIFLLELVFSFPAAATTPWLPNFFFNPLFWGQFTFFSLVESEEQGENVESIFHLIIIAYSGTKRSQNYLVLARRLQFVLSKAT